MSVMSAPPTHPDEVVNTPEYLSWRRLHLAKSKLANVAEMASFMAGFAVVATVELQINDEDVNPALLTCFVITTALLVCTSMLAILISTCILPHIESVAKMGMISEVNRSPHDTMVTLIDLSWVMANTASLFLFTLDVILMCWIKFTYFSKAASIAATAIMAPVLIIILIFGIVFYRKIIKHQYVISNMKYEELERMKEDIDRQMEQMFGMDGPGSGSGQQNQKGHQNLQNLEGVFVVGAGGGGGGESVVSGSGSVRSHPGTIDTSTTIVNLDSGASFRSRGLSSSDSEGSFSKRQRKHKGSIFIV